MVRYAWYKRGVYMCYGSHTNAVVTPSFEYFRELSNDHRTLIRDTLARAMPITHDKKVIRSAMISSAVLASPWYIIGDDQSPHSLLPSTAAAREVPRCMQVKRWYGRAADLYYWFVTTDDDHKFPDEYVYLRLLLLHDGCSIMTFVVSQHDEDDHDDDDDAVTLSSTKTTRMVPVTVATPRVQAQAPFVIMIIVSMTAMVPVPIVTTIPWVITATVTIAVVGT